jgi:hypothetical protein
MLLRMRTWLASLRDSVVGEERIQSIFACFIVRNVCGINTLPFPSSHCFQYILHSHWTKDTSITISLLYPTLKPHPNTSAQIFNPSCAVLTSPYPQKLPA